MAMTLLSQRDRQRENGQFCQFCVCVDSCLDSFVTSSGLVQAWFSHTDLISSTVGLLSCHLSPPWGGINWMPKCQFLIGCLCLRQTERSRDCLVTIFSWIADQYERITQDLVWIIIPKSTYPHRSKGPNPNCVCYTCENYWVCFLSWVLLDS